MGQGDQSSGIARPWFEVPAFSRGPGNLAAQGAGSSAQVKEVQYFTPMLQCFVKPAAVCWMPSCLDVKVTQPKMPSTQRWLTQLVLRQQLAHARLDAYAAAGAGLWRQPASRPPVGDVRDCRPAEPCGGQWC